MTKSKNTEPLKKRLTYFCILSFLILLICFSVTTIIQRSTTPVVTALLSILIVSLSWQIGKEHGYILGKLSAYKEIKKKIDDEICARSKKKKGEAK